MEPQARIERVVESEAGARRERVLVSYNIHSGIGTDGLFDLHRVGDVLRSLDADVIALQEVGDFSGRTSREDQPEHLAEQLGMQMAFGPNVVRNGRRYGNAILSKLPILKSRNYDLSVAKEREPRGALRCDLDLGFGQPLHVFNLHLGLEGNERRQQQALLLTADILRDAVRVDPVIVCGDFNAWWHRPLPSLVRRAIHDVAWMVPGGRERTYPSKFPLLRLDRMYVDGGVLPHSLATRRTPETRLASDHLPLVMRFSVPRHPSLPARGELTLVAPPPESP